MQFDLPTLIYQDRYLTIINQTWPALECAQIPQVFGAALRTPASARELATIYRR